MADETKKLAEFAASLRYEDIPEPVIAITKACLIDTVAVWSISRWPPSISLPKDCSWHPYRPSRVYWRDTD
jgi:2-methylcitrate dehydratase PrpD